MVDTHLGAALGNEEKYRALHHVLESETFVRSERLKSLLRFLCEAEIEGREGELNEYTIGTEALGRPKNFAPLGDSSVRSRAYELRQRLEKYYTQEAQSAPVRIELRKGTYVPRFYAVQAEQTALPTAATAPQPANALSPVPSSVPKTYLWIAALSFVAGMAIMFAAVSIRTRVQSPHDHPLWTPDLETLWRPFVEGDTPLLVVFETRFFVRMGPLVVRDSHVNSLPEVENSEPLRKLQDLFGVHQLYSSGNYTDVGAPEALFYLTRLLSSRAAALSVKNSHELSAADIRDSNLILVGKPSLDPEIQRVLESADLVDMSGEILNRHPAAGEQAEYKDQPSANDPDAWNEKYSVITVMPSPAGKKRILTLTASGSEHPSALAYYMTNPDTVRDLLKHLRAAGGTAPEYYQILVRADFKGKALVKVEYVTSRRLKIR